MQAKISSVTVTDDAIAAHLADGRIISVPLNWSWRLSAAGRKQRQHYELIGDGQGVHWPDVDEDISLEGMLRGMPAKRPSQAATRIEPRNSGIPKRSIARSSDRVTKVRR